MTYRTTMNSLRKIRDVYRRCLQRLVRPDLYWRPVTPCDPPEDVHVLFLSVDADGWWDIWVGYRGEEGFHVLPSYNEDPEAKPRFWMPKDHLLDCKASLHGLPSLDA